MCKYFKVICLFLIIETSLHPNDKEPKVEQESISDEENESSPLDITIIPIIGGSSEKGFSFGAALFGSDILTEKDITMFGGTIATLGDSSIKIGTWNNNLNNKTFSYKTSLSYKKNSTTRYYGIGINDRDRESTISISNLNAELLFGIFINKKINIGLGLLLDNFRISAGRLIDGVDSATIIYPDDENIYRNSFSVSRRIFIKYDSTNNTATPSKGTFIELDVDRSDGTLNSRLIFTRLAIHAANHIPLFKSLILSIRGNWETIIGTDLPFYTYPSIGGGTLLRVFGPYRHIDKHAAVIGSELRFIFLRSKKKTWYKYMEFACFADIGNAANTVNEFKINKTQNSIGAGFRVNISPGFILRFDYATNSSHEHYFYLQHGYPF